MFYRKKPVVIEAIKFEGTIESRDEIINKFGFMGSESNGELCRLITIQTLEGTMSACEGDYIIKGIKGELYPCKEDVFLLSYERIED